MEKVKSQKSKVKIKKGDQVRVLLGKDRGKEGQVAYVLGKAGRVFVEGANIYKRHVRKMPASRGEQGVDGGIIDLPKSMDISNVGLICPNCKKITRAGYEVTKGGKIRICKKCKKEVK